MGPTVRQGGQRPLPGAALPANAGGMSGKPNTVMSGIREWPGRPQGVPATHGELATLWVDGPGAAFNVAMLCRFDAGPSRGPDGAVDCARVRAEVARRAREVPALRRRLTADPHPVWLEEAAFLPEQHV